jgi:hypothetical protein
MLMTDQTTMHPNGYGWKRFWCPWNDSFDLHDSGYLADPDGPYGRHWNADLRTFDEIAGLHCLALLGEPGIGKTPHSAPTNEYNRNYL